MLWATCVDQLKDRINNRSFWEAIEQTHAVTIDGDTLVLGFDVEKFGLASVIQQPASMAAVSEIVGQVLGMPLQVRLIEGTTVQEWEGARERETRMAAIRQAAPIPRAATADGASWESLIEQISRLYSQAPFRALPQGKARYANEALYLLVESMDTLYGDGAEEQTERSLARVLDRIANASEIPSSVLAFELERLRAWRRASEQE
jgi:hypothetical protein